MVSQVGSKKCEADTGWSSSAYTKQSNNRLTSARLCVVPEIDTSNIPSVSGQIYLTRFAAGGDGVSKFDGVIRPIGEVNNNLVEVHGTSLDGELDGAELPSLSGHGNIIVILSIGNCALTEKGPRVWLNCCKGNMDCKENSEDDTDSTASHVNLLLGSIRG